MSSAKKTRWLAICAALIAVLLVSSFPFAGVPLGSKSSGSLISIACAQDGCEGCSDSYQEFIKAKADWENCVDEDKGRYYRIYMVAHDIFTQCLYRGCDTGLDPSTDSLDFDGDGGSDDIDPDDDNDGILDIEDTDWDNDGIDNSVDNCPRRPNPNQEDADGDGIGDICDECPRTEHGVTVDARGCPATTLPQIKILSPNEGEIIWVDPGDQRIHITVTAKVTDPDGDLRATDVIYEGPGEWQEAGLNLIGSGGTGKGSVVLPGKGKYKLGVWAVDEQGGEATKYVSIEIRESNTSQGSLQIQTLKEIHEITKKSIEEAKKKAKAIKDSPTPSQELEEELKRIDKGIEEIESGIKDLEKYTEDVKQKALIEELKVENEKLKMELRLTKSIKDIYSVLYATSVIEVRMKEGIIKTKDNEMKTMRLSDGKSSCQMILSEKTECEIETLLEDSTWVIVKKGVVGWFKYFTGTDTPDIDWEGADRLSMRDFFDPFHIADPFHLVLYTDNAEVTSDHTKFETSYDPLSKITTVTVFEDYVTVKSLKTNDPEMIVSAGQRIEITDDGFAPKIELTRDDLLSIADRYEVAFGGINPLLISTNNPPTASFSIMPESPKTSDTIVVASTSFDPDDDKLTYSWYRDGIYLTEIGDWSDWEWETPQAGEYTIKLVVEAGEGGSDECSMKINVSIDTPGFEISLLIGAIVVALMVIKRRKYNH